MKLLIVDDDSLIRKSLSVMLSDEDDIIVVGTAENGEDAVKMCKEQIPDIVLMDIRMPVMDGITATPSNFCSTGANNYFVIFNIRNLRVSLNISGSKNLISKESLLGIVDSLVDLTGKIGQTLTVGATNKAKLTAAEQLIATNKNWVLA